jgi:hypothetical protein
MSEATVKMTNGQRWTAQQFVDHYLQTSASGTKSVAVPPEAVPVDMSWYMNDGPGRYYHPGMFPIINQLVKRADLAPGSYDLRDFVPNRNSRDPALTASISHYTTDVSSADYPMRALVFGNESARISGQVGVNQDGTKTFRGIEIRPLDSDFNFDHKTKQPLLEAAREVARRIYDPENQGVSYDIQYRGPGKGPGTGRFYGPFSDGELRAGPGALPSGPIASMPGFNEYL